MKNWFKLNLGDAMLASVELEEIKSEFSARFDEMGQPDDMALFIRHESEGRLHCEVQVYFSPACHEVAHTVGALSCIQPFTENLALLVGSKIAPSILKPRGKPD